MRDFIFYSFILCRPFCIALLAVPENVKAHLMHAKIQRVNVFKKLVLLLQTRGDHDT